MRWGEGVGHKPGTCLAHHLRFNGCSWLQGPDESETCPYDQGSCVVLKPCTVFAGLMGVPGADGPRLARAQLRVPRATAAPGVSGPPNTSASSPPQRRRSPRPKAGRGKEGMTARRLVPSIRARSGFCNRGTNAFEWCCRTPRCSRRWTRGPGGGRLAPRWAPPSARTTAPRLERGLDGAAPPSLLLARLEGARFDARTATVTSTRRSPRARAGGPTILPHSGSGCDRSDDQRGWDIALSPGRACRSRPTWPNF